MPVDCLFPTLCESPHRTKMEVSVATMQKRLKEAFEVARHLTYEEATKQCRYYDRRAGAITLQPGTLLWFVPMALWQAKGKGPLGRRGFHR